MTMMLSEQPNTVAGMIAEGRRAAGYGFEEVAIATGLTVSEVEAIELGTDTDESRIRRVAAVLRLSSDI
jgi:hypothetical protein